MRIAYVNHGRFPTEKAYGFQIAQVCDALTALGHQVTLLSPSFHNAIIEDPRQYYGLRHPLTVESLPHFDAFRSRFVPGFLGFAVSMISYGRAVARRLQAGSFDCAYVRSPLLLKRLLRTRVPVILELHDLPRVGRRTFVRHCNRCRLVVCLTNAMKEELIRWGVDPRTIIVEADGVDIESFKRLPSMEKLRSEFERTDHISMNRYVVGYVGSLVTRETLEKGVRELIEAAAILKKKGRDCFLWIVGGPERYATLYRELATTLGLTSDDVRLGGHVLPPVAHRAIAACDLCVYPAPQSDHPYFVRDTSPLKLFEYLAAGKPVVCADLPPVHDVVTETVVTFFRPGDSAGLAAAIENVMDHPEEAAARAHKGIDVAAEHSWEKRMERILRDFSATLRS